MFHNIIKEFRIINKLRWIPAVSLATGAVGLTFEKQLGKQVDTLFFPDFNGIEIKCTTRYSRFPMTLFSVTFDGTFLFQMNRIVEEYGEEVETFADRKKLSCCLYINKYVLVNNKYYFCLKIIEDKMILFIYDLNYNLLNKESYVCLKTLNDRLVIKLSNLAIVKASKKKYNNWVYFRYYELFCYQLKSFDVFIKLLKRGVISVHLESYVAKVGYKKGKSSHKGLVFRIKKEDIPFLFDLKDHLNLD